MLHQDDFALPEEQLPWNATIKARDWDSPIGTVSVFKGINLTVKFWEHFY